MSRRVKIRGCFDGSTSRIPQDDPKQASKIAGLAGSEALYTQYLGTNQVPLRFRKLPLSGYTLIKL